MIELCALYFSRTLLGTLAGAAFQDDADRAMAKIERPCQHPDAGSSIGCRSR